MITIVLEIKIPVIIAINHKSYIPKQGNDVVGSWVHGDNLSIRIPIEKNELPTVIIISKEITEIMTGILTFFIVIIF